ncbi:MAG TPA: HAD-IA family hydrolase [Acidimicrobiales bacterium]|nr:HAD-IA family hydrolase [Acidimicrobiales bacterium]
MARGDFDAVLWDFGGVILSSPFESFNKYEAANGLPKDFIRGLNATNPDTNAWAKMERSEVSLAEFCELFEEEAVVAGGKLVGADVLAMLRGELRPQMVEAQQRIKAAGIRQALLTNNFSSEDEDGGGFSRPELSHAMEVYDCVIESSKAGVRKPDPAAYELVLEALADVPAERIVYLDDLGINLKPARGLGMTTIKVIDPDDALRELGEHLGLELL